MKYLFLFFLMSGFSILGGCRKNNVVSGEILSDEGLSYLKMMRSKDIPTQRVLFNSFSANKKYLVWKAHLNEKAAKYGAETEQKKLIMQLIDFNQREYYEKESDVKEIATITFSKSWLAEAKLYFENTDIYEIAFSLNTISKENEYFNSEQKPLPEDGRISRQALLVGDPERSPYNNEALPDCKCNVGSSFTCPYITMYSTPVGMATSQNYGSCSYASAQACDTEGGCGFMGWHLCDGNRCTNN